MSASDVAECAASFATNGFVLLEQLFAVAAVRAERPEDITPMARCLCEAWNHSIDSRTALAQAAERWPSAANTLAWMELQGIDPAPCRPVSAARAGSLRSQLEADPEKFAGLGLPWPASAAQYHWTFASDWISDRLRLGRIRLSQMRNERRAKVAVLVGNGPSLRRTDLTLLTGHDVFISNYAVCHSTLGTLAKGVAVTNYFVASQAPHLFHPMLRPDPDRVPPWRVIPVWLGHVLADSPKTIWLNALGGELFFSTEPERRIAWHASVSYFWMQLLYALGYRKLLLIGFDHSYIQPPGVREGTLLHQEGDDPNHFDPGYFRNLAWQAADVQHMAQAYRLARTRWEEAGAEIVNCTNGGALDVFRRGDLATELLLPAA